jgi:hypothetical protein
LATVPDYSGVVLGAYQANTPLPLGPDGQRVLCAAIGMMSGPDTQPWQNNLLWQASADISNAISATIKKNPGVVSPAQQALLCAVAKAIWSFTNVPNPDDALSVDVTNAAPLVTPPDEDFSCLTDPAQVACTLPSWLVTRPQLAGLVSGVHNDLSANSATGTSCSW